MVAVCIALLTAEGWAQLETRGAFAVPQLYPLAAASGDFNRDGKRDVAVIGLEGTQVAVMSGNGDGTFRSPVIYPLADNTSAIAAGNLNGDGNVDLAVVVGHGSSAEIGVLLGNRDGTFQTPMYFPVDAATTGLLEIADFNGDGFPDLAVNSACSEYWCVGVMLGVGDGTFQTAIYADSSGPAFAIGDFNGDGNPDIASGGCTSVGGCAIGILLGNGDGTFQNGASYSTTWGATSIAAADFNKDGKLDVAAISGGTVGVVFLGDGDGTLQPPLSLPTITGGGSLQFSDFNGDGNLDLVFSGDYYPHSTVEVLLGNGDGTFRPEATYPAGATAAGMVVGDFNNDSQSDLVVADETGDDVITLLNTGVVSFSPTTPASFGTTVIGTTSNPQTITLTNGGTTNLSISSIKATRQYEISTTCGGGVAPGANCAITVTFTPRTIGNKTGTVSIVDSASSKPQVIELTGTGTEVSLSPTKLNFGTNKVGSKTTLPVQMTSEGTTTISISSISIPGTVYTETNNCGSQLGAGATCTIEVTFIPASKGKIPGTLSITDNGGGSPQTVGLTGTGD